MNKELFIELLTNNLITFSFIKKTGEERIAVATVNPKYLAKVNALPKNGKVDENAKNIAFYDSTKNEWRSLSINSLATVILRRITPIAEVL